MKERITRHFDRLFEDAPKTRKALDLKQEMLQNALDKYDDMVQEGNTGEDAYQNVIQSIGDVTELFEELEEKNLLTLPEKDRKKRAMLKAAAVGLYILAVAVFMLFSICDVGDGAAAGLVAAIFICIVPTILLVYSANMYPGYTRKKEPDMVERYKEEKYYSNKNKAVKSAVSCIIWTMALVLYFLISFTTVAWHITWVIFLIAACAQSVAALVFSLKQDNR